MTTEQIKALIGSFLRVLLGSLTAAVTAVWATTTNHDVLSWGIDDVKVFTFGVMGAFIVTLINFLRPGETRFGVGAETK